MVPSPMADTRRSAFSIGLSRLATLAAGLAAPLALPACAPKPAPILAATPAPQAPTASDQASPTISVIIDGTPIPRERLLPALFERAGREVIDELTLDLRLRAELSRRGLALNDSHRSEEASILAEVAGEDASALRRRAGISAERLSASLERSAMLRLLARESLRDRPADEDSGRVSIRERAAIVVRSEDADVLARAWPDSSALIAVRENEASEAISPALAQAIFATPVGETTPVVITSAGSVRARVLAERSAPIDPAARSRARQLNAERDAMDRIARELLAKPGVTVMERGIANARYE